jgi:hypothetical protein
MWNLWQRKEASDFLAAICRQIKCPTEDHPESGCGQGLNAAMLRG